MLIIRVLLSTILLLTAHGVLEGRAPVPFGRHLPRPGHKWELGRSSLVGLWAVKWGTVDCTILLSDNGDYTCNWPGSQRPYLGTWGVVSGPAGKEFTFTESNNPESASSWQTYRVHLGQGPVAHSLTGPVVHGAANINVDMRGK